MNKQSERLDDRKIQAALEQLSGWKRQGDFLQREFTFKDFSAAFAFMTRIALLAEQADHHPNWSNVYNRVDIQLSTHDAGGITQKDVVLASAINKLND